MGKSKRRNRRLELICEAHRHFLLADRNCHRSDSDRSWILFRRHSARFHGATSKPRDAQIHALRQFVRRLAVARRAWSASYSNSVAAPEQKMDAHFFINVVGNGARRGCGHRRQTRNSKGPPFRKIRTALGWPPFQHEISCLPFWPCWSINSVFWRFVFGTTACGVRLSANSDFNRALPNVPWRALPFRRCVCGSVGDAVCSASGAFFSSRIPH
jgi:hypothetical protein